MSQVSFIAAYRGRWISDNLFSDFAFQALEVNKDIDINSFEAFLVKELHLELIGFVSNVHSIRLVVGSEFEKTIRKLVDLTNGVQLRWKYGSCFKGLHGESSVSSAGLSWSGDADVDTDMDLHLVDDCDVGKIPLSFGIKSNADFYMLSCIVDGCTWMIRISRISGRDIWFVRKYLNILVLVMLLATIIVKLIPGRVHLYTFLDWSDLRVTFSAWRVLGAPSAEQILKPSLSKPSTLGTEYRTGLAPTSIPGPYSASNPGLGIGHVDDPPAADATHLLLSPVKSPPAANHSDGHCCPFTGDAYGTLLLTRKA
ncbi:hypothetical protein TIFTF001_040454 [Ficus carica]|uniref:Uncharacterized protein n=1 Tax=Ficus carica TaxID=3494 RepID=A0AA87ZBX3_FICCA|nr:hypothetical protein TIFTF001_040450 [Ficus carica]GMN23413.1 hypothetical protein TIFTF001_040454 [Ficus carica]